MNYLRNFKESDWAEVWTILEPVFRAGETYPFSPDISESESKNIWIESPEATFVVEDDAGNIIGTYYIKPNQPALGAHVCNCGYVVAESARGKGVASQMCAHSQQTAIAMGFKAMQFNLVVSTNCVAVSLWKKQGFTVAGELEGAFCHKTKGYVDALVMYKKLE